MIVPCSRLLYWVAAIVLPFSLAGSVTGAAAVSLVFIGGLFLVALADAFNARKSLAGICVDLPPVARMSKDRAGKLELRIRNPQPQKKILRFALAWPREIKTESEEMEAAVPGNDEWSRLNWPCTPTKRGNYLFNAVFVEAVSPLGFWKFRKTFTVSLEIRVYPNLLTERKSLAALFLNRGAFGLHAQRQIGKGRDFEKLREYTPGDDYGEIHWKATARWGKPITKVFQIEKTQEIYVILDSSRLSARAEKANASAINETGKRHPEFSGTQPDSAIERFITAGLVLGLAAERQGDLFGLITFADKVETFVRAKNNPSHFRACRDALYTLQSKIVTPDFDEICAFIRLRLRRRALLVFLTALDDPAIAENFVHNIGLIRRQHLVLVNMLQPPGLAPLFKNPQVSNLDDLYQHLGGHLRWQKMRELQKVLQRQGVQFSLPENEHLSADLVSQYLAVKQRQML